MTRGRLIWLAVLAVGLVVGLLLRVPNKAGAPAETLAGPTASQRAGSADIPGEVEVEVESPRELAAGKASGSAAENTNEIDNLNAIRGSWEGDPARALALATEGERLFGDSPRAVERRLFEIKALVKLERIGKARTKAQKYLELYPPGPMTDEVERLTGVHRRPPP